MANIVEVTISEGGDISARWGDGTAVASKDDEKKEDPQPEPETDPETTEEPTPEPEKKDDDKQEVSPEQQWIQNAQAFVNDNATEWKEENAGKYVKTGGLVSLNGEYYVLVKGEALEFKHFDKSQMVTNKGIKVDFSKVISSESFPTEKVEDGQLLLKNEVYYVYYKKVNGRKNLEKNWIEILDKESAVYGK